MNILRLLDPQAVMCAARAARAQSAPPHVNVARAELLTEELRRVDRIDATPQKPSWGAHVAKLLAAGYRAEAPR